MSRLMFISRERGQTKINLRGADGEPQIVSSVGIKRSDLRRLFGEVLQHRDNFFREWERIHGQPD